MKWKNEAMEKLRRYDAMRCALRNIPGEIQRLKEEAAMMRRSAEDRVAVKNSPSRRDDALIDNLMKRQELEWALKQVRQWLAGTDRGLMALSEEERLVLQRLYLYPQKDAISRLCTELGIEQSSVYRKRDQALERFTLAMYGYSET